MHRVTVNELRLTKVSYDAAMFLHHVFKSLQGVVDGAKGQDDLRKFTLQCLQLVVVYGASDHTVAI